MALFRRRIKDGRRGQARVVSASGPPRANASYSNCRMDLVVEVEGMAPYAHTHKETLTPVAKWPFPGTVLPVEVAADDPTRLKVLWKELPGTDERRAASREAAERMAASMRGETPTATPTATPSSAPSAAAGPVADAVADRLQQLFPGAQIQVGGQGVPGAPPVEVTAARAEEDPVARLEKLARLKEAGVVDDAQFEALRAQILGQAGLGDT